MSMQQRNTVVSLVIFCLILGFFGLRVFQLVQTATFTTPNVLNLWAIAIGAGVAMTIVGIIVATIGSAVVTAVRTGEEPPKEDYLEDERDKLIGLKGTQVSYVFHSLGVLIAMISFVLNQPPLVMFTLLIASGLIAQIAGDVYRLLRYRSGV